MLDPKIFLNDLIIKTIQTERIKKNITSAQLSKAIERTPSYISSVENGRIGRIAAKDLIKIFEIILEVSSEQSVSFVQELLKKCQGENSEGKGSPQIITYEELDKIVNPESYAKVIKSIDKGFEEFYKFNPKLAFLKLNAINTNLHFDMGLMISIMSLNYTDLAMVEVDKRKDLIKEIKATLDKYTGEKM